MEMEAEGGALMARKQSAMPAALPEPVSDQEVSASGIVSSAHLASPHSVELSEFEFGMIIASNAFNRWAVRCMAAAGLRDLTITDVLVLHHVHHRARNKKLADICFILNVEDTHVISYSLKKLVGLGVVTAERSGKEVTYATSESGRQFVERYRQIREKCLVSSMSPAGVENAQLGELARFLRLLSGLYDQAARSASSL
jgi:predicted MarR family transcription regulator